MKTINAEQFRKLFLDGANNLSNNKEYINELNVFPVPDGDTGTNMTLTIMAAASDVKEQQSPTIDSLAKAISGGSLRGARGNSGVILSQLFRGFCKDIRGKKELTIADLATGCARGVETAYKAVMKPKEGTILTVARGVSERAAEFVKEDDSRSVLAFVEDIVSYGEKVLEHTPELLPVLAEAGVVDSGGQGLIEILKGILKGLKGETVEDASGSPVRLARGAGMLDDNMPKAKPAYHVEGGFGGGASGKTDISTADIKFAYCTEFIILLEHELKEEEVDGIKEFLLSIGDSLVCVADEEIVKIHVHTNHPGLAFEKGLEFGQLTRMKIDNMKEEHSERVEMEQQKTGEEIAKEQQDAFKQIKMEMKGASSGSDAATEKQQPASEKAPEKTPDKTLEKKKPPKKYGFVAIAVGEGIASIFKEIGVDEVISGGQTMNPSTEDVLTAVEAVNAETVFVLPNNKNIILAANQAAGIIESREKKSDDDSKKKQVIVIPATTIPQGISAMIAFSDGSDPEANRAQMTAALSTVKSGEVTFSVRDTSLDGKSITKGDIMGIDDGGISAVGKEIEDVTIRMIENMMDDDTGLITLYFGEDIKAEEAEALQEKLLSKYPEVDIDLHAGGQPIYYYMVSVE